MKKNSPELSEVAGLYRLGRHIEAGLALPDALVALMQNSRVDQARLAAMTGEILQAQERKDWLGLADWLQYETSSLLPELE